MNANLASVGVPAYERDVEVRHLLWELAEGEGYERLKGAAHKGLKGLKIAPFYGCQILRPVADASASRTPTARRRSSGSSRRAAARSVDYPAKLKCCGFPIIQAREETALGELIQPIEQAVEAGADAMVTPCPLCHLSLDAWQQKLEGPDRPRLRPADPPPLAADRRRRRARGVGAEVQAARRLGEAVHREARGLMAGHSVVAPEVVGRYARDAACEVAGVARVVEGVRKGVRVDGDAIVLHLALDWGVSIPDVGAACSAASPTTSSA